MATSRDPLTRRLMLVFAGITSVALLIASIALLIWVKNAGNRRESTAVSDGGGAIVNDPKAPTIFSWTAGTEANTAAGVVKPAGGGKRFTLRLGQGFRFKDGV